MRKQDAVEVAHQIAELIRTRALRDELVKGFRNIHVPLESIRITMAENTGETTHIQVPPHVLRHLALSGAMRIACDSLIREHEDLLRDLAGITVEE